MDTYEIEWKSSALRELKRLDPQTTSRILDAVQALSSNPLPVGARKLQGVAHTFRIRVGHYRVVYEVYESRLVVCIVRVRHRSDAYRR